MGRDARLHASGQKVADAIERRRLQGIADQVQDEGHWAVILDSCESQGTREELERVVGPMLPFRRCSNHECESGSRAIWQPVLLLRADEEGPTSRLTVLLRLCSECKEKTDLSDVLNEDVWVRTVLALKDEGKGIPRLDLTRLTFDAVS